MTKVNLRAVPVKSTIAGCISDGYGMLTTLRDEAQEIIDNAPEGLQQTDRISTFEETVNQLDGCDSEPDLPEYIREVEVTYTEDHRKSKSHSRSTQCSEACEIVRAGLEAMESWIDDNEEAAKSDQDLEDKLEEVRNVISEINDFVDNAEGTEWPGMFG